MKRESVCVCECVEGGKWMKEEMNETEENEIEENEIEENERERERDRITSAVRSGIHSAGCSKN